MHNGVMKAWLESSHLAGANATYVEDLYELYLSDPDLVSDEWKHVFEELPTQASEGEQPHSRVRDYFRRLAKETKHYNVQVSDPDVDVKQVKVLQLINAYRFRGHQLRTLILSIFGSVNQLLNWILPFIISPKMTLMSHLMWGLLPSSKTPWRLKISSKLSTKSTVVQSVLSICTSPTQKRNAGSKTV